MEGMARGIGFSGAVLFLIVFAVVLGVFVVIRHGVSARDQPTAAEIFIARHLRHLAIPAAARNMTSPHPSTPETVEAGMEHFADHCATCHANDGSGDTEIGRNLYPKAPDMRKDETQSLSDGELYYIIENGIRFTGMPGWGGEKPEPGEEAGHDSWALVHFIRHLPKLSETELAKMKSLNPKSPEEFEQEQQMKEFLEGDKGSQASAPAPREHEHQHEHH